MILDDIERLARASVVKPCDCVNCRGLDEPDESILARFALLALPVLRASLRWDNDALSANPITARAHADWLRDTIAQMRRGMGE